MCQEKSTRSDIPLDELRLKTKAEEEYYRGQNQTGQIGRAFSDAEIIAELFKYHPPNPHTGPKFDAINQAAKNFAEVVLQNCPRGVDRETAIAWIRSARMFANAAISLNGVSL